MAQLTKNRKKALELIKPDVTYTLSDAAALVKEMSSTKFDSSVDVAVRCVPYVKPELIAHSLNILPATWFDEHGQWGNHPWTKHRAYAQWLAQHGVLQDASVVETTLIDDLFDAVSESA